MFTNLLAVSTPTSSMSSASRDRNGPDPRSLGLAGRHPGGAPRHVPPINVGVTPDRVDVYVFAGGLDPKTLDISMQQNLLAVSGSRKLEMDEAADYYRRERFDGEFRRVITLPDDVDPERVDAKYRDGVLQITIQRREAAQPRQITVN